MASESAFRAEPDQSDNVREGFSVGQRAVGDGFHDTIRSRRTHAGYHLRTVRGSVIGVRGWCSGRDSNPYTFRHTPLKRTCLPIPPPEQ